MGASITAYSGLKLTRRKTCRKDSTLYIEGNAFWPERHLPFKDQRYYSYEDDMDVIYLGYGRLHIFREQLAKFAGYALNLNEIIQCDDDKSYAEDFPYAWSALKKNDGPFSVFLSFTDCDGVIGYIDCIKLLKDFEENYDKAMLVVDDKYLVVPFKEIYVSLLEGLKFASHNGALVIS